MKITDLKPQKMTFSRVIEIDNESIEIGFPIIYFHYFSDDNELIYQGFVDSINESYGGEVVFFDWIMGGISKVSVVTKLFFDNCVFYKSAIEMIEAYENYKKEND